MVQNPSQQTNVGFCIVEAAFVGIPGTYNGTSFVRDLRQIIATTQNMVMAAKFLHILQFSSHLSLAHNLHNLIWGGVEAEVFLIDVVRVLTVVFKSHNIVVYLYAFPLQMKIKHYILAININILQIMQFQLCTFN